MLLGNMKEHLEHISKEVKQLKKMLIYQGVIDRQKTEEAWKDLLNTLRPISEKWRGPSAVEEIREQREKEWQ